MAQAAPGRARTRPHTHARALSDEAEVLRRFRLGEEDLVAWRDSGRDFAQWLTDRVARRPAPLVYLHSVDDLDQPVQHRWFGTNSPLSPEGSRVSE